MVDTLGLMLAVFVHPANVHDRDGGRAMFQRLLGRFARVCLIWADGGYAGQLMDKTVGAMDFADS